MPVAAQKTGGGSAPCTNQFAISHAEHADRLIDIAAKTTGLPGDLLETTPPAFGWILLPLLHKIARVRKAVASCMKSTTAMYHHCHDA